MGARNQSAILTLVERSTRYVLLGHLPGGPTAQAVRDVLATLIGTLPEHLRRSLTWDQGAEMAEHRAFSIATTVPVYFCDPASPWQRGSNENTNGLLRQYFPRGPICPSTAQTSSSACPASSTRVHAKRWTGRHQPSACSTVSLHPNSPRCCDDCENAPCDRGLVHLLPGNSVIPSIRFLSRARHLCGARQRYVEWS